MQRGWSVQRIHSREQFPIPGTESILSMVVLCFQVSYGDEKFPPSEEGPIVATPTTELLGRAKEIAQVCVCKGGAGSR